MAHTIVDLECPGCGAPINTSTTQCPYCFRDIVITTFNSVASMSTLDLNKYANAYRKALTANPDSEDLNMSIAFCYFKLKLYDKAVPYFEKAIENNFDNSEAYFYTAIALLGGKKAFLAQRPTINKIEEYINAAIMIEPKGIYYLFHAYIKHDYYHRKFFKTSPTYKELIGEAQSAGVSAEDVKQLSAILGTELKFN